MSGLQSAMKMCYTHCTNPPPPPQAVLSTYVASTAEMKVSGEHDKGQNGLHEVPHLCMVTLHGSNNLPRNWGTKCARMLPEPKLTNSVWGAGLSFSR